jgi:aspartate aminotransferase
LREAVAAWAIETQGVRYPVESVLIASGVRPLLYAAFKTVVNPGDTVVYGVPSWNVNHYVWLSGAKGVVINPSRERGFHPTAEEIAPLLAGATLLCLCSPANPTGTMMDPTELGRIAELVVAENARRAATGARALFLLWDQVYGSLVFGGEHANPVHLVPASAPWVIALDGASKAFAATGLRVGWSFAAPAVTARMRDFLGHVGAWAPRPEQIATAKFIRNAAAIAAFRETMDAASEARLEGCMGFGPSRPKATGGLCPSAGRHLPLAAARPGRPDGGREEDQHQRRDPRPAPGAGRIGCGPLPGIRPQGRNGMVQIVGRRCIDAGYC